MTANLYDDITAAVIAQLENGTASWVKPLVTVGTPFNPSTGRAYSGVNVLLLWTAMRTWDWASNAWLTFKQLEALGGRLKTLPGFEHKKRTGQTGTTICHIGRYLKERIDGAGDRAQSSEPYIKLFTVFNLDQIEGLPANLCPAPEMLAPADYEPRVEALIDASNALIIYTGRETFYAPSRDAIIMPAMPEFLASCDFHNARFHELIHWTGHPSRCNRFISGEAVHSSTVNLAMEELVANIGAGLLSARFGIKGSDDISREVAAQLIGLLRADRKAIFTAARRATQAVEWLLAREADTKAAREVA